MLNQRESFFRILHCLTTQIRYFVGRFFFERMSVYKNSESFAMWLCLAEYRGFFDITNDTTFFNYPFDFESITFFFPYAWAIDPSKPTLTPKYESVSIPYKVSLSKYDILNIQREYKCGIGNNYIRLSQDKTYRLIFITTKTFSIIKSYVGLYIDIIFFLSFNVIFVDPIMRVLHHLLICTTCKILYMSS